jgi:hypothetical protein
MRSLKTLALVAILPLAVASNTAYAQDDDDDDGMGEEGEGEGEGEGMEAEGEGEGMEGEGEGMAEGEGEGEGEGAVEGDGGGEMTAGAYTKETWPTAFNDRPLTNAKGMIEIRGELKVNLSTDAVAKPLSIAPDIYYAVSDKLMVGLTHDTGICVTGEENGCISVYNDLGLDALFSLTRKPNMEIAAHGGLLIPNIKDTLLAGIQLGISGKWTTGKIGVFFDPKIYIGVTERDFNKEVIFVPVMLGFQASPKLHARLVTGINGPLDGFGDSFTVPVGVGALFGMSNKMDVGGQFTFGNLAGKNGGADARQLDILVNFRL